MGRKVIDLTGQKFGNWEVINRAEEKKNKHVAWNCKCICGTPKIFTGSTLLHQRPKSCGCLPINSRDISNQRFGRLVAKEIEGKNRYRHLQWSCVCDCGNKIIVSGTNLRNGMTRSCGCLQRETIKNIRLTHGMSGSKISAVRGSMIQRCHNPNSKRYKYYGGRGITVCEEWLANPKSFYTWAVENGYKIGLTIDRIDNNKGYYPDNCRWVSHRENCMNTRSNRYVTLNNDTKTIGEWCKSIGMSHTAVYRRWKDGWSLEEALTLPKGTNIKAWRKNNG